MSMVDTRLTDADVRHDDRQQHQISDNNHCHPDTRRNGQLLNNADINKQ